MAVPSIQNTQILASWALSGDAKIYAEKKDEGVFFHSSGDFPGLTEKALQNVRGWIPPEEVNWNSTFDSFYERFKPITISDNSVILSLFEHVVIHRITSKRVIEGKVIGWIEKKVVCLLLKIDESIYLINDQTATKWFIRNEETTSNKFLQTINGKINHNTLGKIKEFYKLPYSFTIKSNKEFIHYILPKQIFVKQLHGRTITLSVDSSDTIMDCKLQVLKKIGIPTARQSLLFSRMELEDDLRVVDYWMLNESTMHLVLKLSGGGLRLLPFVNMEVEKRIPFDPNASEWKAISPGLNLKGRCDDPFCDAFDQVVWIPKGFGTFNMNKECTTSVCSACQKMIIEVNNLGLYQCTYSIEGMIKKSNGEKIPFQKPNTDAPDMQLLTFDDNNSISDWCSLTITTQEINEKCIMLKKQKVN